MRLWGLEKKQTHSLNLGHVEIERRGHENYLEI